VQSMDFRRDKPGGSRRVIRESRVEKQSYALKNEFAR